MLKAILAAALVAMAGSALAQQPSPPPLQVPAPSDLTIALQRAAMFESQAAYLQSVLAMREHQWSEYAKPLWEEPPEQKPSAAK